MLPDCLRGYPAVSRGRRRSDDAAGTDGYGSNEAVDRYREKAERTGLSDVEAEIVDEYFTDEGASVLDIGCGAGRTTKPLADRGFDVIGIDRSDPMIGAARDLYPDLDFRVDDATDLSFPAGTFDYVLFSNNGIDYVYPASERVAALQEIHRVLRPGGDFVFSAHNWLYVVPAVLSDLEHVRRYYVSNGNLARLGSPYKKDADQFDVFVHLGTPTRVKGRLADCGFELLEWVTKRRSPLRHFEVDHYYVARRARSKR